MNANDLDSDAIEFATQDRLRALQLSRLRWSLQHAYDNVAHYRQAFEQAGVTPENLTSLADLSRFPFLLKAHFREHYPLGLLAVPRSSIVRIHASSGTTGKATVVGYTARDLENWAGLVARSLRAAGVRAGDAVHIAYGYGLFTGGLGAHAGAERLGCTVIPASGGQTQRQVQLIRDLQPRVIMVTPSYMLVLAEEFERQGIDPRATSLEIGIFGAEPWTESMRQALERRFRISALDIYGLSEVMGPGVAQECAETKDGLCLWEDHFYPEIIDPDTGEVLPEGELGELVLTSLTKEAIPVIRYRTRDLTRLLPPTARSMRRLARILARSDDMLIVRGINVFPSQIEDQILVCAHLGPHYVIEISRPAHLDEVTVAVEMRPGADERECRQEASALMRRIKDFLGVSVGVDVRPPGAIARSAGKAARVIDTRAATVT
ncbi:MAG: phenylacetate--CoA ligase PaaK [Steroidobacteraceae bacterium]